jgi:hypothetical protein
MEARSTQLCFVRSRVCVNARGLPAKRWDVPSDRPLSRASCVHDPWVVYSDVHAELEAPTSHGARSRAQF